MDYDIGLQRYQDLKIRFCGNDMIPLNSFVRKLDIFFKEPIYSLD